jgi:hypothetical protein
MSVDNGNQFGLRFSGDVLQKFPHMIMIKADDRDARLGGLG